MYEANAPKVWSGGSCWMFAILFLAVLQTCSTELWSGAYGGRKIGGDAFQEPARPVEAGQRFRVVEPGIVQHDSDPVGLGFTLEPLQSKDDLLGVLVPLDRIQPHSLVSQRQDTEERLGHFLPVHVELGALPLG